jgi:hypothetical protein
MHELKAPKGSVSLWNADLKSTSNGPAGKIAGDVASGDAADLKSAFHFRSRNADLKSASNGPAGKIAGHSASGDAADLKSAFHFRSRNADLKSTSNGPAGKIAGHSASGDAADLKSALQFRSNNYKPNYVLFVPNDSHRPKIPIPRVTQARCDIRCASQTIIHRRREDWDIRVSFLEATQTFRSRQNTGEDDLLGPRGLSTVEPLPPHYFQ